MKHEKARYLFDCEICKSPVTSDEHYDGENNLCEECTDELNQEWLSGNYHGWSAVVCRRAGRKV